MLQVKEQSLLLPEQKTFLLSQGKHKTDSIENVNNTLITASDVMDRTYKELFQTVIKLTSLDDSTSEYHGDVDLNDYIILAASNVYSAHKMIDRILMDLNPGILKDGKFDD